MKTAADIYMPCDGKILKINERLEDEPQHISIEAESEGWLMEMEIEDTDQLKDLLDEESYLKYLDTLEDDHWFIIDSHFIFKSPLDIKNPNSNLIILEI